MTPAPALDLTTSLRGDFDWLKTRRNLPYHLGGGGSEGGGWGGVRPPPSGDAELLSSGGGGRPSSCGVRPF